MKKRSSAISILVTLLVLVDHLLPFSSANTRSDAIRHRKRLRLVQESRSLPGDYLQKPQDTLFQVMPLIWYPRNFTNPDITLRQQAMHLGDDSIYSVQLGLYVIGYREFKDDNVSERPQDINERNGFRSRNSDRNIEFSQGWPRIRIETLMSTDGSHKRRGSMYTRYYPLGTQKGADLRTIHITPY